ncbi:MAG: helix-turn-helix domain-containing protein [Candidatus Magasanikbacteria bacterium]|nr:helix-turn-helix domain-containing protein [Candidatus Magasanikbacteria bacterium]
MNLFSSKILQNKPSAVNALKENRIKQDFSIAIIARRLSISPKFIESLENAKYNRLPGEVYIKNFIKKYSDFLKLNTAEILAQYEEERANGFKKPENNQFIPVCKIKSSALMLRKIIVASLVLFLITYLSLEVGGIYKAPKLILESPTEGQVILDSNLLVKGLTNPEMKVQINGVETVSDGEGNFSENVILNAGNNQIIVTVIKKHGRSQTVTRNVVYREKKENVSFNN